DVAEQQSGEKIHPIMRAFRQHGDRQPQQSVESEFFQHAGVQHRGRRRRGRISFRRPRVKRKERNENSEADEQQKVNVALVRRGEGVNRGSLLQFRDIETALRRRKTLVEQDQSDQQNETAEREIDRDLPGRAHAISRSPNPNQKKCRDQRELVKRVKEKQIGRSEGADRAGGNEK